MNIRLQGGKNASVYIGCQRAFSLHRAGDISALVCLNSHRQSAVRQHNHHTVPLLHLQPSSSFLSFTAVVFLLFITESVKCSSFFMRWLKRLTQHGSKWPQITACIGLNYEALFCGTHNKAVKPIWTLFTTGQMVIPYAQSTASFGTLALYDGRSPQPLILLLFLPSLPFLRGPGVCGTITMAHKGKWVPCVWWRGAVAVTRYSQGGIPPGIHL